jgi:hypothetical protein
MWMPNLHAAASLPLQLWFGSTCAAATCTVAWSQLEQGVDGVVHSSFGVWVDRVVGLGCVIFQSSLCVSLSEQIGEGAVSALDLFVNILEASCWDGCGIGDPQSNAGGSWSLRHWAVGSPSRQPT